ncbi:MAG: archaetidylserine decarboxylase [Pseudomonadota bacterium]
MADPFIALQHLLPRHALTRLVGRLAASERGWVKTPFIRSFARAYGISLEEAERASFADYESFNAFFTRALREEVRPLEGDDQTLVSPVDGSVSQLGTISEGTLFQAKGNRYRLDELLGCRDGTAAERIAPYEGGRFATLYLAPSDYHRIHVPRLGTLIRSTAIPGTLFSVNGRTEAGIANLFCQNERLALEFETDQGPLAMVLVGALIVGSIETVFGTPPSPYRELAQSTHRQTFTRGSEIGRFLLGSTVIVCTGPAEPPWRQELRAGSRVLVGQSLTQALKGPA